ncbi:XRE family transcriptional regulator [Lacihabitans lacunae]|jgi:transcriptional regulator with XRE-family HTH domain|uniref:XRE family transcriptional regulator n=1 Tax=Lacihabitans lacunae TaxID=1028214 RepID=A0ABV7Z030_9BACT
MKKISKNIAHLRHLRGVSQEYLANDLNITRSRLSSWEEHRAEPPIDLIVKLSEYFNVSIDSLLKIDLTKVKDLRDLLKIGGNRILFPVMVDSEGKDLVELVPIKASAGYLDGYSDETFIENLPRISLPFAESGKFRGFPIKGDSMPPLESGAYVVGSYVESVSDIKDGKTYVVLTQHEGLVYKRLYNKINEDGNIHLHSDNKAYAPYKVKPEEIFEIWSFVCSINATDSPISDLVFSAIQNIQADVVELKMQRIGK